MIAKQKEQEATRSAEIESEICRPPEWDLIAEDMHKMVAELEHFDDEFSPCFARRAQATHGWVYLKGLLGDLPRKVTAWIALRFGKGVRRRPHVSGPSALKCEGFLKKQ